MQKPTLEELRRIAEMYNFQLSEEEENVFQRFISNALNSYASLDNLSGPNHAKEIKRGATRPDPAQNRHGAWAWRCEIKGTGQGLLISKSLGVKDNVSIEGVPLSDGSRVLQNFVPDFDATIVTRILDAGGEIIGTTTCEDFCFSGGSHTSYPVPVLNPHNPEYMAGGSSSGSAVLVALKEIDMAIGGDQGGSIRIPSSWCGIYGLKPTWGLVPYTGIVPIELTLDHAGPMANTVHEVSTLLEVIAGRDGLDPRQSETPAELPSYTREIEKGVRGLRVGVVSEGFGYDSAVDSVVKNASLLFQEVGMVVGEVSVPIHKSGPSIWAGIINEGSWAMMIKGRAMGHNWKGRYDTNLVEFFGASQKTNANFYPPTVKAVILLSHYLDEHYNGRYYSKAQNLRRVLERGYEEAFANYDFLLMPTTRQKPGKLKQESLWEYVEHALDNLDNTCPFDVTGHPAISIPCGFSDGLPIGMMLVGRRFQESMLLRAARAFEIIMQKR